MLAPQMNRWTHIVIHSSTSTTFSDNTRITKCNFAMTVSVNAGQKGFSPIIGHSVWGEKLYTHQWLCQTCTMSVLPVWNLTIAFTMSMSNFNILMLARIFNKYQDVVGRFLLLMLPSHTRVAPTCSARFSPAQSTKVKWFQKHLETLKSHSEITTILSECSLVFEKHF